MMEHEQEFASQFSVVRPFTGNPRLISIFGSFPHNGSREYKPLDELLWLLVELDRMGDDPITLVLDSPGGNSTALTSLLDHIGLLSSPVHTVARTVHSLAAILFVSGEEDHRYVFENSTMILHAASEQGGCPGHRGWNLRKTYCVDEAKEKLLGELNYLIASLLLKASDGKILNLLGNWEGVDDEEEMIKGVLSLPEDDTLLTSEEMLRYGLADHIIDEATFKKLFSTGWE